MASFSAELRVNGTSYPLTHCTFGVHQETYQRGRTNAKVRHGLVQLTLDVPADDGLLVWAATPDKRQAAAVVFRNAAGGQTMETLALDGAYCVAYAEEFVAGAARGGAYQAFVTLSDPDGFTLQAGGPASAFVPPAAREHGVPSAAAALVFHEAEQAAGSILGGGLPDFPVGELSAELTAMLGQSILIERAGGDEGPDLFEEAVKADLQKIYSTPTGRKLLDSLHASGKPTTIQYALDGLNRAFIPKGTTTHLYQADGTPGEGVAITVGYNPGLDTIGKETWSTRPPAIALAHELIHAEQAAHGRMRRGSAVNPGAVNKMNPLQPALAPVTELETVGVPPHDEYHVTENKIRAEWTPPQPNRDRY